MFKKGVFKIIVFKKQLKAGIDEATTTNPKLLLSLILLIVSLGVIHVFVNRSHTTTGRTENIQNLTPELPYSDSIFFKKAPAVTDIYDILRMESDLEKIMKKDSLSKEDSAFIMALDKKLNNMINE